LAIVGIVVAGAHREGVCPDPSAQAPNATGIRWQDVIGTDRGEALREGRLLCDVCEHWHAEDDVRPAEVLEQRLGDWLPVEIDVCARCAHAIERGQAGS
jgi:hypothetical protein